MQNLNELNKNATGLLQLLSNSLQECISREYSHQGIEGYNKCFIMFSKVLEWETRKNFIDDPSIKRGIDESIKSKEYQRMKSEIGRKM